MGKLLKYELKGSYKVIGIILSILALTSLGLYTRIGKWNRQLITGLNVFIIFGVYISMLIYMVLLFKRDLYEDTGYLTFTLPLTGNQIIGAKLISSVIWIFVIALFSVLFFQLNIGKIFNFNLIKTINSNNILFVIFAFLSLIIFLFTVYFSITISKVTLRNKKIGGLWFIIFIVLNILIGYIQYKITKTFPYYININDWTITNMSLDFIKNYEMNLAGSNLDGMIVIKNYIGYVNVVGFIYNLIVMVGLFLGTGYLVENKINI